MARSPQGGLLSILLRPAARASSDESPAHCRLVPGITSAKRNRLAEVAHVVRNRQHGEAEGSFCPVPIASWGASTLALQDPLFLSYFDSPCGLQGFVCLP